MCVGGGLGSACVVVFGFLTQSRGLLEVVVLGQGLTARYFQLGLPRDTLVRASPLSLERGWGEYQALAQRAAYTCGPWPLSPEWQQILGAWAAQVFGGVKHQRPHSEDNENNPPPKKICIFFNK